jgi:hypothetical protein
VTSATPAKDGVMLKAAKAIAARIVLDVLCISLSRLFGSSGEETHIFPISK